LSDRTIFISDVHLGTRGCQAELLMNFLDEHDAPTIYLVGDILDGWKLSKSWYWPQSHDDLMQAILEKSRSGTKIILIPGNHDAFLREHFGTHFSGIEVMATADFITVTGKRYLVCHGDQFDAVVMNAKWLAHFGDRIYRALIWLNPKVNALRSLWTSSYWSLSKWAKNQVKQAVNFIGQYEDLVSAEAKRGGYDGVICGHIHHATMRDIDGVHYVNTGDWVESCTAIIEDEKGALRLVDWEARISHEKSDFRSEKQSLG